MRAALERTPAAPRLPVLLRHARRSSENRAGRAALPGRVSRRDRSNRRRGAGREGGIEERPGLSIKLSALHPRYEIAQRERVMAELLPRLLELAASRGAGGHTGHDGRGGIRPAHSLARALRARRARARARRLGRARPRGPGLPEARARRYATGLPALAAAIRPAAHGAAREGRLLGHRDQARAGAGRRTATRCTRARAPPTFRT